MPSKKPTPEADERLSQLLRLKRQERPDAAFWDKFDEELRSKQLTALVRTQSWHERLGKLSLLVARKSAAATAAVSVFALGIFAVSQSEFFTHQETNPAPAEVAINDTLSAPSAAPLFVVEESLSARDEIVNENFVPTINAQPTYEVHALRPQSSPKSYQVIATPKQFTVGAPSNETSLGAKVIRAGNQF